ncbi:putative MATE family efflux protein [Pseudomonas sp. JAI115]|uniref:MATE family efflux transporter n=1 Tax=Pseudomonas sp. JAI115 TaxID=2723061 RepID=UPI00161DF3E6|nr:MATE family efflux transporter [Pseudomonas sp. JAI115]MBB6155246.1 putative MATE family efflux protein [Pseudomonas sp. JAI115]
MSEAILTISPHHVPATYRRYAWPTVFAMLVSGFYQMVDGIFIGHFIGADGLAAINTAWPWVGLIAGVGLMMGMGTGIHCSIAQGQAHPNKARQLITQGLWLFVLTGLAVGVLILVWGDQLLRMQGVEAQVLSHGSDYLRVFGWCSPLIMASLALPILVRNLGAPMLATGMMLIGALLNVLLDYMFIVVLGWGLEGAAWATVTGESVSVIIGLFFLCSRRNPLRLHGHGLWTLPQLAVCQAILGSGFSSLLMYLYASFAVVLHNAALMHYGDTVHVAAYAVTGYVMTLYYLLAEGLATGMQPMVSYFHGAGLTASIRQTLNLTLRWIAGTGLIFVALIFALPYAWTRVFVSPDDTLLTQATVQALQLHLFALFIDGLLVLAGAYFQAINENKKAVAITLANMLVQVPALLVLAPWLGVPGVFLALPVSTIILGAAMLMMLRRHAVLATPPPSATEEDSQQP